MSSFQRHDDNVGFKQLVPMECDVLDVLHPDLLSSYTKIDNLMWIHHKYVVCLQPEYLPPDHFEKSVNGRYTRTLQHYNDLIEGKRSDWGSYFLMVERGYRLQELLEVKEYIPENDYLEILRWVWTEAHYITSQIEAYEIVRLFESWKMTAEEQVIFDNLPNTFTIYRGCFDDNEDGISWTLSRKVANIFAKGGLERKGTKAHGGKVVKFKIAKEEVLAFINTREEQEILLKP